MTTVYLDVLITVNIFIDFFLILCVKKVLRVRAGLTRMILGSLLGGVLSLVAVYFVLSFGFCGLMIFVYTSFHPGGMEIFNDTVYFNISPFLLIILTLVCYYTLRLLQRLTKGVCGRSTCNVEIALGGSRTSFFAAVDTGCTAKEPFSGEYVIFAEEGILRDLRLRDDKIRIIPFESLGGGGIVKGYRADSVIIDGKRLNSGVYLGVCQNILSGEIKALVPSVLLADE